MKNRGANDLFVVEGCLDNSSQMEVAVHKRYSYVLALDKGGMSFFPMECDIDHSFSPSVLKSKFEALHQLP